MGISLADAKVQEEKTRKVVLRRTAVRDAARKTLTDARAALKDAHDERDAVLLSIEQLKIKLAATKEAIMPSENASRLAGVQLDSAQKELAKAREERIAAEAMLVLMEKEKEQAERLLEGAQEDLEKSGEIESTSREHLDEKLQDASDAQQVMNDALHAIDEARTEVEASRAALFRARAGYTSLPRDEDSLAQAAEEKLKDVEKARKEVEWAQRELDVLHAKHGDIETLAQAAREEYDRVQKELHEAEAAKDRAQANLRIVKQLPGIDPNEREQIDEAQAEYDTAVAHCEEVQEKNKQALTAYADADVEVIRFRLANEEATKRLEEAQALLDEEQQSHQALCDAAQKSADELRNSSVEVAKLEQQLRDSEERLARLENEGMTATEHNKTAQRGLKEMQEIALRYGRQSRNAASILDGRRHKLSDIVSAIEVGLTQLDSLKRREEESASRVDKAYAANQRAYDELNKSKGFIYSAQKEIDAKTSEVKETERRIVELAATVYNAEQALSTATRELQAAQADYTDAQVSVIMAEIL